MEQIKPNYFGDANIEARTIKDIIEPAKSISNKVFVRAALDQMQAQATDSSPVIDQCGELLGILSKNKMNRNVGGFGHDPKTEPVDAHIEKNNAYCFEDQTIAEAEQMMLNAKLLKRLSRRKDGENAWPLRNHVPESASIVIYESLEN